MMDPVTFLTYAMQVGGLLIQVGEDVAPFAESVWNAINGKDPTQADWDKLHAEEARLRTLLNQPAP